MDLFSILKVKIGCLFLFLLIGLEWKEKYIIEDDPERFGLDWSSFLIPSGNWVGRSRLLPYLFPPLSYTSPFVFYMSRFRPGDLITNLSEIQKQTVESVKWTFLHEFVCLTLVSGFFGGTNPVEKSRRKPSDLVRTELSRPLLSTSHTTGHTPVFPTLVQLEKLLFCQL